MSVGSQSEGQLSCCDVRAVSDLSVVQDLGDVARDRSFKHVFLGVGVTISCRWDIALSQQLESLFAGCYDCISTRTLNWKWRIKTPTWHEAMNWPKWRSVL